MFFSKILKFQTTSKSKIHPSGVVCVKRSTRIMVVLLDLVLMSILVTGINKMLMYFLNFPSRMPIEVIEKYRMELTLSPEESLMIKKFFIQSGVSAALQGIFVMFFISISWLTIGTTPAKLIFNLKLIDIDTKKPPTKGQLIKRIFYASFTVPLFGIGVFAAFLTKYHQTIYDKISNTLLVTAESVETPKTPEEIHLNSLKKVGLLNDMKGQFLNTLNFYKMVITRLRTMNNKDK